MYICIYTYIYICRVSITVGCQSLTGVNHSRVSNPLYQQQCPPTAAGALSHHIRPQDTHQGAPTAIRGRLFD